MARRREPDPAEDILRGTRKLLQGLCDCQGCIASRPRILDWYRADSRQRYHGRQWSKRVDTDDPMSTEELARRLRITEIDAVRLDSDWRERRAQAVRDGETWQ